MGNPLSLNLYTYVQNNPLGYIDPSGHDAIVITNPDLALKNGHTSALIQDKDKKWHYFYWGDENVQYVEIDDKNALKDIKSLNEWGSKRGLAGFSKSGYTSSTYIRGDFTPSHDEASRLAGSYLFEGVNPDYSLFYRNCVIVAVDVLSKGILDNGVSASRFFDDDSYFVPNADGKRIQELFYNSAYTLKDYSSQLKDQLQSYEKRSWLDKKLLRANFHIYRINILSGQK